MTKNKNLFKNISLFLCLVPMLLLALFVAFPKKELKSVAAADIVQTEYKFVGSDLITVAVSVNSLVDSNYLFWSFASVKFNIFSSSDFLTFEIGGDCLYRTDMNSFGSTSNFHVAGISVESNEFTTRAFLQDYSNYYLQVLVRCSDYTKFTANINSVRFYSTEEEYEYYSVFNTFIRYYDVNGEWLEFSLRSVLNDYRGVNVPMIRKFLYDDRTYYFPNAFENSDGYDAGYNAGYVDGNKDGNKQGYIDGYGAGESVGYGDGYNDGLEQSNNYTFLSLIGAVMDAPISAFTSLLNFNLLGFNMLGFVTGLITLSLIIFIVKLILGGK